MKEHWWLTELSPYEYAYKLVDGPHNNREGAEKANVLFKRLHIGDNKRYAVACVMTCDPQGWNGELNESAIEAITTTTSPAGYKAVGE